MDRSKWVWMPHPGHFICARDCRFFLSTYVGGFIVSTVGELLPDVGVREIEAQSRGITLVGIGDARRADYMRKVGWSELGLGRIYETMVFKAAKIKTKEAREACCPYRMVSGSELDMQGYNEPKAAYDGHLKLCLKWSKK